MSHSILLVPFAAWQLSHRKHHKNTGNLENDEVFVPVRQRNHRPHNDVFPRNHYFGGLSWFLYLMIGAENTGTVLNCFSLKTRVNVVRVCGRQMGWPFLAVEFSRILWRGGIICGLCWNLGACSLNCVVGRATKKKRILYWLGRIVVGCLYRDELQSDVCRVLCAAHCVCIVACHHDVLAS